MSKKIEAKVEELKKKHNLKQVIVLQSEDGKVAFLKKPSRDQMKFGMANHQNDPLGLTEHILECGWLEGDEELKNNDEYFYQVSAQIDEILHTKSVEIKKY